LPEDVASIAVHMPYAAGQTLVVDNREMPDVNIQYIMAVALLDGTLTFEAAHSYERMSDPAVVPLRKLVSIVADSTMDISKTSRQAIVYVTTKQGEAWSEHVTDVRGTAANPMSDEEVEKKCLDLFRPVLGADRSRKLAETIWNLENVKNMVELRPLLRA
jgi:2-methylcitrate dehydratase PrpD